MTAVEEAQEFLDSDPTELKRALDEAASVPYPALYFEALRGWMLGRGAGPALVVAVMARFEEMVAMHRPTVH